MNETLAATLLGVAGVGLFALLKQDRSLPVELEKALALVVEGGCDVVRNNFHLYRDKGGKYVVLTFDRRGKDHVPVDETFDDLEDAVGKFVLRAKL